MAVTPRRGLPVPPDAEIDPSGLAPVTAPEFTGTAEDASPTSKVLAYLQSRGYKPTTNNVRRALEANQRDPGVIPGLRSDRPATDAEDQAAMAAVGKGSGSKNTSAPPPGGDLAHPVDLNWQTVNQNAPAGGGDSSGLADAAKIAGLVLGGAGGLGAAGYGAYKLSDRFNPPPVAGPGASVPPPVDPGAGVPGAPVPPPSVAPSPEAQVTPMDQAMNRALEPRLGEAPPLTGVQPIGPPGGADTMPPRGPVAPVTPETGAPQVPFRSDPALRTSPNLRGVPTPLRPVARPNLHLRF